MIPGPFSICKVDFLEATDAPILTTLTFGFDSAEQAYAKLEQVAREHDTSPEDCVVLRIVEREEAHLFKQ